MRTDPFTTLLVGDTPPMLQLYGLMQTAARVPATVLLEGETGTGKELVARGIHEASPRRAAPFLAINCAALPESLLESLLFGHRKGAFTGADKDQVGLFGAADTGTLLLDEIGDMPLALQAKLLRVLQDGEVTRVGDAKPERVDVRIIAATNHTLLRDVGRTFRADLYYRLAVLPIHVPPLRARPADVPLLARNALEHLARRWQRPVNALAPDAAAALIAYSWPGNVRELENELARAMALLSPGATLGRDHLARHLRAPAGPVLPDVTALVDAVLRGELTFDGAVGHLERSLVERAMRQAEGVITAAAELLGTTRRRLSYVFFKFRGERPAVPGLDATVSELEWRLIGEALEEARDNRALAARMLGLKRSTLNARIARYYDAHPNEPRRTLPPEPVGGGGGDGGIQ